MWRCQEKRFISGEEIYLWRRDLSLMLISYTIYKARFQIEFKSSFCLDLFRDAKPWSGLRQCQARAEKALHYHFALHYHCNASQCFLERGQCGQTASFGYSVVGSNSPPHLMRRDEARQSFVFSLASCKPRAFNEHLPTNICWIRL